MTDPLSNTESLRFKEVNLNENLETILRCQKEAVKYLLDRVKAKISYELGKICEVFPKSLIQRNKLKLKMAEILGDLDIEETLFMKQNEEFFGQIHQHFRDHVQWSKTNSEWEKNYFTNQETGTINIEDSFTDGSIPQPSNLREESFISFTDLGKKGCITPASPSDINIFGSLFQRNKTILEDADQNQRESVLNRDEERNCSIKHVHTGNITASKSEVFHTNDGPCKKSKYVLDTLKPFTYQKIWEESENLNNGCEESSASTDNYKEFWSKRMPNDSVLTRAVDKTLFKTADKTPNASKSYNYKDREIRILYMADAGTQTGSCCKDIKDQNFNLKIQCKSLKQELELYQGLRDSYIEEEPESDSINYGI